MKGFDYQRPETMADALGVLAGLGDQCRIVAGGTNLIAGLRSGDVRPQLVLDIGQLEQLKKIESQEGRIRIGALVTLAQLIKSALIKEQAPVLWRAASQMAGPLVRNRATLGGNLVDASPAADSAVPLLALGASVDLAGQAGERTVPLKEFFLDYRQIARQPQEILTGVHFSAPGSNTGQAYHKLGRRSAMAISVASAAVVLEMEQGLCRQARIALGAVAPFPMLARKAGESLAGQGLDEKSAGRAAQLAAQECAPISDLRATADYRRKVVQVLARRLILQCA